MHARCPACKNRTGFSPENPVAIEKCPSCGHVFPPAPELNIASPDPELVVVGARGDGAVAINQEAGQSRGRGSWDEPLVEGSTRTSLPYDPGFHEAVAAGHMTARQAAERGDRNLWASKLVKRYKISMDQALLLTDNKATLDDIGGTPDSSAEEPTVTQSGHGSRFLVLIVLLLAGAVAGFLIWRQQSSGGAPVVTHPKSATPGRTEATPRHEVLTDAAGEVISVTATTPQAVLDEYCRSAPTAAPRAQVRVVPWEDGWLGVFRQGNDEYSIMIRKDLMTGFYTAGDGASPLVPKPSAGVQTVN